MVAWFAALFYLPRLFVYHAEALDLPTHKREVLTERFRLMESRLYRIICNPAMMVTWFFGIAMIGHNGMEWYITNIWLHFKVGLVILLTVYHLSCKRMMKKLAKDEFPMSSEKLRLYNEIPTLLLVAIIAFAVLKSTIQPWNIFLGILILAFLLFIFARVYKSLRKKKTST